LSLGVAPPANVYNPNRNDPLPDYAPVRNGVYTRGETQTVGAYIFDTMSFAERWQSRAAYASMPSIRRPMARHCPPLVTHPTLPSERWCRLRWKRTTRCSRTRSACSTSPCPTAASTCRTPRRNKPPGGANFTLVSTPGNANRSDLEPTEGSNLELGCEMGIRDGALA
jgi:catecholate siderophore receptor